MTLLTLNDVRRTFQVDRPKEAKMNEAAFDMKLFESYKPGLTSYCYRMLGSIDDADDAVQETYIRAWQSWDRFRQDSSIKTWVYRIASNLCLDKLRQAKRRTLPVDLSDPDALVRKDTLQLCFIALLQTLPPRQRAVLILKDVFEWSSKQIAETLGMSPAAANSALQRARETMDRTRLRSDEFSKMNVNPDQNLLLRYVEAFEQFDIHA